MNPPELGAETPAPPRRRRRWWRLAAAVVLGYGVCIGAGMPIAVPFDLAVNVAPIGDAVDLTPVAGAGQTLVVLQHGLWRSHWSMWRLERALRSVGYQVVNPGYPSTDGTIEQHAQSLRDAVEAYIAAHGAPRNICYVGHSMGGLVIQEYLRRPDARPPAHCVYIATPHRGAILCDLRKNWWPYPLLMGTGAAMQISPSDPFHRQPIPCLDVTGVIVGDIGEGSPSIPGHDDGTVGVEEASLPSASDAITLPFGHTAISEREAMLRQVLSFLATGRFAHDASAVTR